MKDIKDILQRYWNCETSLEEEQLLKAYFSQNDIPDELAAYQSAFLMQSSMTKIQPSTNLTQSILNKVENEMKMKQHKRVYFYPAMKVAASILILVSAGIGVYTHYQQEKFLEETFSETYTNPEDALKETRAALDKVSTSLSKAQDFIDELQTDSVQETTKVINTEEVE